MENQKSEENLIQIKDLYLNFYTYDGVVKALDGVTLNLRKGEILGLVGETGCGKSVTSLSVLSIVVPPGKIEKGQIHLNVKGKSYDILSFSEATMRRVRGRYVSMIFQEPRAALNPVYSVGEQIGEAFLLHRKEELINSAINQLKKDLENTRFKRWIYKRELSLYEKMLKNPKALSVKFASKIPIVKRFQNRLKEESIKRAIEMLRVLNVPDPERVVNMYPHEMSGGMAQRVVIAMALSCNPIMLIADEPTTNLDVTVQAQILILIKELQQKFGSAILYVTHDLGVVAETCDRVAVMYAGNVVELADVFTLFKKPLHPYAQGLLESIPRPGEKFVSIPGTVPSLINPPSGCRFHDRCQYELEICRNVKPKLVEVEKDHMVACHLYAEGR
jgi:peptide/nickel transport system ATP-binding protein